MSDLAFEDLPIEAVSAASRAVAERWEMGALHIGSHTLLVLLNEGHVYLAKEVEALRRQRDLLQANYDPLCPSCGEAHSYHSGGQCP